MSAIRISQVVAFSRTLSVHLNPRIEGTEIVCPQFSGGRFCQVVARTGSTVPHAQYRKRFLQYTTGQDLIVSLGFSITRRAARAI